MNAKDIIKQLKAQGWQVLRQEGSHVRLGKESAPCQLATLQLSNPNLRAGFACNL
jgi:predicted RNA binding protein YcfA (HicA-like mRNA interferase family)